MVSRVLQGFLAGLILVSIAVEDGDGVADDWQYSEPDLWLETPSSPALDPVSGWRNSDKRKLPLREPVILTRDTSVLSLRVSGDGNSPVYLLHQVILANFALRNAW